VSSVLGLAGADGLGRLETARYFWCHYINKLRPGKIPRHPVGDGAEAALLRLRPIMMRLLLSRASGPLASGAPPDRQSASDTQKAVRESSLSRG